MSRKRIFRCRGVATSTVVIALFAAVVAVIVGYVGFAEARKAYWDTKVREFCEKDGGMKVFEVAVLDDTQYRSLVNNFGQLAPPDERVAPAGALITHSYSYSYLRTGNPEVRRSVLAVVRRADNKTLGISVSYSRVGGDWFAFHPSYYRCPEKAPNIFSTVVVKREENK